MRKLKTLALATLLSGYASYAAYVPVALTGFTDDVIAEGIGNALASTTIGVDGAGWCLVAQNFQATSASPAPAAALPNNGLINSVATAGLSFQLANYTGNNVVRLAALNAAQTLTFSTPIGGDVYVLGFCGDGTATATITVTFTDLTTQVFTGVSFPDWYNGTGFAIQNIGRVNRNNNTLENPAGNPRLYERVLTLSTANQSKQIASVNIQKTAATAVLNILAISVNSLCTSPAGLAASGITSTSAIMNWGAVPASTGYEWAIGTTATPPASGTAITPTTHSPGGLTPSTTYYYHVRNKCNATTFSAWTTVSFTTAATCASPGTPSISSITQISAVANWGAVAGSLGYEYALTTVAAPPASGTNIGAATNQSLSALTPGTTYYFHVRNLCTGSLISSWSTVSFTTQYPPCQKPTTITVSNINVNGANLSWNTVTPSTGYEWVVTTSATPPATGTPTPNANASASGLTGGTLYYVHVRNNCGPAGFSPWTTTTFTTSSSCSAPTNIIITNVGAITADIQWDPVPGALGFEYIVDNSPQSPSITGAAIGTNKYVPNNLVSATRYFVHLRTNCGGAAGYSSWVTVQFTTDTLCFAPVPVVNNITGTSADIRWLPEANAQNYQYYVSTSIIPPYSGYATTATDYRARGLTKNTQYYMHLRTYCGGNDISAWRSTGFVTNDKTTDIGNKKEDLIALDVYPNPASEQVVLTINGLAEVKGRLVITDIAGKAILQQNIESVKTVIATGHLVPGVYMLKYSDEQSQKTVKLLKQ